VYRLLLVLLLFLNYYTTASAFVNVVQVVLVVAKERGRLVFNQAQRTEISKVGMLPSTTCYDEFSKFY